MEALIRGLFDTDMTSVISVSDFFDMYSSVTGDRTDHSIQLHV